MSPKRQIQKRSHPSLRRVGDSSLPDRRDPLEPNLKPLNPYKSSERELASVAESLEGWERACAV